MLLTDKGSGSNFTLSPPGTHAARCVSIIDLGTHDNEWQGKVSKKHDMFVMWELPNEMNEFTDKDGNEVTAPFTVSAFYTASLSEKANLRKILESWRGRAFTDEELQGFDPKKVLGQPCMLTVIHKPKQNSSDMKTVVAAVSPMPKGMDVPAAHHDLTYFSIDDFTQEDLDKVSDGLKNKIMQSDEYLAMQNAGSLPNAVPQESNPIGEDEIPF